MSYEQLEAERRRLRILKILKKDNNYTVNETLLKITLKACGFAVGRDLLRTEMAWLKEQGLIEINTFEGSQVAKLAMRGLDAAEGDVVVPGVARPEPEF